MTLNMDLYNANVNAVVDAAANLDLAFAELCSAMSGIDALFADTRWSAPSASMAAAQVDFFRSQISGAAEQAQELAGSVWWQFDIAASRWGVS